MEIAEALWLDAQQAMSLSQLAALSGLSTADLQHLVECEALLPLAACLDAAEARFGAECLVLARTASRLRNDFDLDAGALALTLQLLRRISELEAELHLQRALTPHVLR